MRLSTFSALRRDLEQYLFLAKCVLLYLVKGFDKINALSGVFQTKSKSIHLFVVCFHVSWAAWWLIWP
jgi:hypothetical protein